MNSAHDGECNRNTSAFITIYLHCCQRIDTRGRGLTVSSARVLVQALVGGPGISPTSKSASCPRAPCLCDSMHHGGKNWAIPRASTKWISDITCWRRSSHVPDSYRIHSFARILVLPRRRLPKLHGCRYIMQIGIEALSILCSMWVKVSDPNAVRKPW